MVFSSVIFLWIFLPIVVVGNMICQKLNISNYFLLLASLLFYSWGEPIMVLLMIVSILVNYVIARLIDSANKGTILRKLWLIAGIVLNLIPLGYYKYSNFLIDIINDFARRDLISQSSVILPIGISFYTFQAISYICDVYRGETTASKKISNVALYISFFPQLIAGPIVKYTDINKQIEDRKITLDVFTEGFKKFIYGLGKKVIIANVLGQCADNIYEIGIFNTSSRMAWIVTLMYTFQIYYDFSGYSDMAIGLGRMFGFNIPKNFDYPYMSKSISEFWRRWHISLGSWFREYIYIPLGGNRKGKIRTYINLAIVFIITGIWHGAGYNFVLWGIYNGIFVLLERLVLSKVLKKLKIFSWLYSFFIVNIGWILFKVSDINFFIMYVKRLVFFWQYTYNDISIYLYNYLNNKTIFVFILAVLGAGILQRIVPEKIKIRYSGSIIEAVVCIIILMISIMLVVADTYNPFIYYQF